MSNKNDGRDEVFLRNGTSMVGDVHNETFKFVDDLGERPIKSDEIWDIIYAGPGSQPQDRIRLRNGSVLVGDVIEDPVVFKEAASGTVMELHKDQVLTIMLIRF